VIHEAFTSYHKSGLNRYAIRTRNPNYSKKICGNIAWASIASIMWHLVLIDSFLKNAGLAPYYALCAFVAVAAIPARKIDRHWEERYAAELNDAVLVRRYRIDLAKIWTGAILLPVIWVLMLSYMLG
jgi:hypothetical protein